MYRLRDAEDTGCILHHVGAGKNGGQECTSASGFNPVFKLDLKILSDFDRASSLICRNKMPTRYNR
jgi:hypothetical protein